MNVVVGVAEGTDLQALWRLNHQVYCVELGQHPIHPSGMRVDRMHQTAAVYVSAKVDGELVGMLSVTPPGGGKLSTIGRIPEGDSSRLDLHDAAEVRLLAVRSDYRALGIYDHLMLFLMKYCAEHHIDRVVISAIGRQERLYALMGFKSISAPIREGDCMIQPMLLLRSDFDASAYRTRKLASMELR